MPKKKIKPRVFMTNEYKRAQAMQLAASVMGSVRSERKAKSSRQNGKLGGRPVGSKDKRPRVRRSA